MANSETGFGLAVSGRQDGVSPNFSARPYPILYSYGTSIGQNDAVKLNSSTGNVERYAAGDTPILGVAVEFTWYSTSFAQPVFSNFWPATPGATAGSATAYVIDDSNAEFFARVSGAATTQTSIGSNMELVTTNTPNAAGYSTETVLSGSEATTATLPVRVLAVVPTGPTPFGYNDATLDNNIIKVKLNAANLNTTTGV